MNINMRSALIKIDAAITSRGGEALVVGGAVRDMITVIEPKDVDLMIRRLPLTEIAEVIGNIGKSVECGQSFGIVKGVVNGIEFDFAIPRTSETKTGDGHADFSVVTDPFATVEMDLSRRDFTCNAMAIPVDAFVRGNVMKIIDPHGGHVDVHCKLIRAVGNPSDRFREDPLRMLRAIQFATRMGFKIHNQTATAIRENLSLLKTVSGERVLEEF
jgi:tRNA nucleotidyltransferase (CCA-adding enzyme)